MSLLTIVQQAALRCNFGTTPSSAMSSTDNNVQQLVAFAQDIGDECLVRYDWNWAKVQKTFTGDGSTTLFPLPSDWNRLCPSDKSPVGALVSLARPTIPLVGPVNDEWLNQMKALPAYPAYPVWRIIKGQMEIWPALANAEVVQTWYFSKNWIAPGGVTSSLASTWASDSDTSVLDEKMIRYGVIYRWKEAKGLDYAEDMRRFEAWFERQSGAEDNERTVSTSDYTVNPDTFWPGQISYTPP